MFSSNSSSKAPTVSVVGAETLVGQYIARQLARGEYGPRPNGSVRGVYGHQVETEIRPLIEWMQIQGVEPHPANYNEVASIEQQVRGTEYVVICPPLQQNTPQSSLQESQRLLQAVKNANMSQVILLSWVGMDQNQRQWMSIFQELEKQAKEYFGQKLTVVRLGFVSQQLRFIAPKLRQDREWYLPVSQTSAQFTPVDMEDVSRVIFTLVQNGDQYRGQVYQLFGSRPVTLKELQQQVMEQNSKRSDRQQAQINLRNTISRDEFQNRLIQDSRRVMQEWGKQLTGQSDCGAPMGRINNQEGPFYVSPGYAGLFADQCELMSEGKLNGKSDDWKKVMGNPQPQWQPMPIERFFRTYAFEF